MCLPGGITPWRIMTGNVLLDIVVCGCCVMSCVMQVSMFHLSPIAVCEKRFDVAVC